MSLKTKNIMKNILKNTYKEFIEVLLGTGLLLLLLQMLNLLEEPGHPG